MTIRSGSLTRSRRRSAPAPLLPTLAGRSPTRRRSGWRASAMPTSTPTGRRRTTSSPTPTRSTRCSSGSGPPTPTVTSGRARRTARRDGALPCSLSQCAAGPHPGRGRRAARRPARRCGDDPRRLARRLRPAATGRSRGKAGGTASHARPFAAGADRHARARGAARRCRLPCLSDAGGRRPAVHRVGRHRKEGGNGGKGRGGGGGHTQKDEKTGGRGGAEGQTKTKKKASTDAAHGGVGRYASR